jgi:hypothetical protein
MKEQKPARPVQTQQGLPGTESLEEKSGVPRDIPTEASLEAPPGESPPRTRESPLTDGSTDESPLGGAERGTLRAVASSAPKPESTMQPDAQSRKGRARLNRDTMSRLGKTLEAYFDDVRKEGVPDRFRDLLQRFDENKDQKDKGSS